MKAGKVVVSEGHVRQHQHPTPFHCGACEKDVRKGGSKHTCVGLARTIHRIYTVLLAGRLPNIQSHTVTYGVYIWFWPTLRSHGTRAAGGFSFALAAASNTLPACHPNLSPLAQSQFVARSCLELQLSLQSCVCTALVCAECMSVVTTFLHSAAFASELRLHCPCLR